MGNVIPITDPTRYEKIKSLAIFIWSMDEHKHGHWNSYPYITMAGAIMEQLEPIYTKIYNPTKQAKRMSKRLNKLTKKGY